MAKSRVSVRRTRSDAPTTSTCSGAAGSSATPCADAASSGWSVRSVSVTPRWATADAVSPVTART